MLLVSKVECGGDVNTKETFNFIRRQEQTVFNGYKRFSKKSSKKDAAKGTLNAHKKIIREKICKKDTTLYHFLLTAQRLLINYH